MLLVIKMPADKRLQFRAELNKQVNKEKLHSEILAEQQILDYETYRNIMCLMFIVQRELQDIRNDACFRERMSLLEENDTSAYNKLVSKLNDYNRKIEYDIMQEMKE